MNLLRIFKILVSLFFAITTQIAYSATAVEYYNPDLDHYFITADSAEQTFVDGGSVGRWQRTGTTFPTGGNNQVCRFYGSALGPNSHFYTADSLECSQLKSAYNPAAKSWKFESYDFSINSPVNGACAAEQAPVYRAYNNGFARDVDSNHRITPNLTDIQQVVAKGWSNEGIVMCSGVPQAPPISVVLYTHIEDNTPMGTLGTDTARTNYLFWRDRLIQMATLAKRYNMVWLLQPDWKILVAAQQYEDASTMASTGGKNILLYLRDNLGAVIDAHSHENGGYNYTDVAYLLTQLGVGGTTVIGGHVWDPTLPQFAHWERFRVPVAGIIFPSATWRGDILIGAGTPSHTNDPIVSGVWRPKDPTNFWVDDPAGNITSVGGYKLDIAGIPTLTGLYASGKISTSCMLTSTYHIIPAMIESASTLATLERDVLQPLNTLRSSGQVEITDFTSLVAKWKNQYASKSCLYQE